MKRLAKVPLCPRCTLDGGWLYAADGSFTRCDHGAVDAAVAAAEAADRERARVIAARRARATGDGHG